MAHDGIPALSVFDTKNAYKTFLGQNQEMSYKKIIQWRNDKKCKLVILSAQGQHGLFDRMSPKLGAMDEPLVTGCKCPSNSS